ncbi:hypothetical protein Syun_031384 [Stephania yunnanensis]|uniref:Secreted protein n=1 Tax=Stephania yunnanensis TaxID=152371 RepID=A0AAP0DZP2_9MAGN
MMKEADDFLQFPLLWYLLQLLLLLVPPPPNCPLHKHRVGRHVDLGGNKGSVRVGREKAQLGL